jgi:hypothetical protein
LARHWIDAIQNSLLGALLVRLWPILPLVQWAAFEESPPRHPEYLADAWSGIAVLAFLAWTLGFMAIHAKPKGRWAIERIQGAPRNAFEVWSVPPAGGLKPPRLMKAIVMALGQTSFRESVWRRWFVPTFLFGAIALLLLSKFDQAMLASVSPSLAGPGVRIGLFWGVSAVMVASILRTWAVDCRKRLEADVEADGPVRGVWQGL